MCCCLSRTHHVFGVLFWKSSKFFLLTDDRQQAGERHLQKAEMKTNVPMPPKKQHKNKHFRVLQKSEAPTTQEAIRPPCRLIQWREAVLVWPCNPLLETTRGIQRFEFCYQKSTEVIWFEFVSSERRNLNVLQNLRGTVSLKSFIHSDAKWPQN